MDEKMIDKNESLDIEALLKRLKSTPFNAMPTVATYDMGLQYDYVMPEGAGSNLGSMGQWPAYWFAGIPDGKWQEIRNALSESKLTIDLLHGTDLHAFAEHIENDYYGAQFRKIELNDMLSELLTLPDSLPERFFSLFDMGYSGYSGHKPLFFETEEAFLDEFKKSYCWDIVKWDEMTDESLIYWADRIDMFLGEFPYYHFSGNSDSEEENDD